MNAIQIEGTAKKPTVNFEPEKGIFELKGNSIPEDAGKFYKPIMEAVQEYIKAPQDHTTVNFTLYYFNSATAKWLSILLNLFKQLYDTHSVEINWYYQEGDEDIYESGDDYKTLLEISLNLISFIG